LNGVFAKVRDLLGGTLALDRSLSELGLELKGVFAKESVGVFHD
jgi:hypothetical protein